MEVAGVEGHGSDGQFPSSPEMGAPYLAFFWRDVGKERMVIVWP